MDYLNKETKTKNIRFDIELHNKIEKLAKENDRDFSSQVRFICKQWIEMTEKK